MIVLGADTSSLILLLKGELLHRTAETIKLLVHPLVVEELLQGPAEEKEEVDRLLEEALLHLVDTEQEPPVELSGGEAATIELFHEGHCQGILVDDREAITYCSRYNIPFINALLVPRMLEHFSQLSHEDSKEYSKLLASLGRYSKTILDRFHRMTIEDIAKIF